MSVHDTVRDIGASRVASRNEHVIFKCSSENCASQLPGVVMKPAQIIGLRLEIRVPDVETNTTTVRNTRQVEMEESKGMLSRRYLLDVNDDLFK